MELRKDYVLNRWSYIAEGRGKRPMNFSKPIDGDPKKHELFAPGNEHMTPPEIGRRERDGKWYLRWFANKFPAVSTDGDPTIHTADGNYTWSWSYGYHEILVETPDPKQRSWDFDVNQVHEVLQVYNERTTELLSKDHINFVSVFKNSGREAGASLPHSHSQLIAQSIIPPLIAEKLEFGAKDGVCAYCNVVQREKDGVRKCFENNSVVAFTPYAPRSNWEVQIFPKRCVNKFTELSDEELRDTAEALHFIQTRLKIMSAPYNYHLQYSPSDKKLHAHIEVIPRMNSWAGFELSTGTYINTISPEQAAEFYRTGE